MVDQSFKSWNPLLGWLRHLDVLATMNVREVAGFDDLSHSRGFPPVDY
jgi:hypothetical protein